MPGYNLGEPERRLAFTLTHPVPQFFNFVALPMYQSMAQAFPGCTPMLEAVQANFAHWTEQEAEAAQRVV